MHTTETVLDIEDLSIGYYGSNKRFEILQKDLNLSLSKGDFVCLIGPNGCGKSTFIRSIASLQRPIKGKVIINGRDIKTLDHRARNEFYSVVLTDRTAVNSITVAEIVSLGRYQSSSWLGSLCEKDKSKINWAISQVDLVGFENRMYGTLSDGEKQRAYIAKALASDAPIMLLDEPTAHLDVPNRAGIMFLLQRLTSELGYSIILSTHDLDLAFKMADEIWLMHPAKGVMTGTPEELLHSGYLNDFFGKNKLRFNKHTGTYSIYRKNKIPASIEGDGSHYEITLQALHRLGYTYESNEDPVVKISVGDQKWTLYFHENILQFQNFSEMCRSLKTMAKNFNKT